MVAGQSAGVHRQTAGNSPLASLSPAGIAATGASARPVSAQLNEKP